MDIDQYFRHYPGQLIPLCNNSKRPLHTEWTTRQDYPKEEILRAKETGLNLGLRLSAQDLVVDIDPRNGGEESFRKLCTAIPCFANLYNPTVATRGGGHHYYFRKPAELRVRGKLKEYPGIDFLSHGRFVVIPGSRVDGGAWSFAHGHELPPPPAPPGLLSLLDYPEPQFAQDTALSANGWGCINEAELDVLLTPVPPTAYQDHEVWLQLMMACHYATAGAGLAVFLDWSTSDPLYSDHRSVIEARWNSLDHTGSSYTASHPITARTLLRELSRFDAAPTWFKFRLSGTTEFSPIQVDPIPGTVDSADTITEYTKAIEDETDNLRLISYHVRKIAGDSRLSAAAADILLRRIARKTGTSIGALKQDLRIAASEAASKRRVSRLSPEDNEHEEEMFRLVSAKEAPQHLDAVRVLYNLLGGKPIITHQQGAWWRYDKSKWALMPDSTIARFATQACANVGLSVTSSVVRSVCDLGANILSGEKAIDFDADHPVPTINAANGHLVLRGGEWVKEIPHPNDCCNSIVPAVYDPSADLPERFLIFLNETLAVPELSTTVAVACVYTMLRTNPWLRKCFFLYGPTASGKTVLLNTLISMWGPENCSYSRLDQICRRFGAIQLRGKLANISGEVSSRRETQEDMFKGLVSGDWIDDEIKNGPAIHFKNRATLWFAGNSLPKLTDESTASVDRICLIRCPNSHEVGRRDPTIEPVLIQERDQIFNWALKIFAKEYTRDRCYSAVQQDPKALEILRDYFEASNPALRWLTERTEEARGETITMGAAYADYEHWCKSNGHFPLNAIHFSRRISAEVSTAAQRTKLRRERIVVGRKLSPLDIFS